MAALDKRIRDLEAQTVSTDHCVKVFFCNEGDDEALARLKAGIPLDYAGNVVCVRYVESPNALKELGYGNA
jgi:hypothetical protein